MPADSQERHSTTRFFSEDARHAARARLERQGLNIGEWAVREGFDPGYARNVIEGFKACRWGVGHDIAVALGLKKALVPVEPARTDPSRRESRSGPEIACG